MLGWLYLNLEAIEQVNFDFNTTLLDMSEKVYYKSDQHYMCMNKIEVEMKMN